MKRIIPFLIVFLWASVAWAQNDPLNPAFLPSIDTTCADYPTNVWVINSLTTVYQDQGTAPTCVNGAVFGAWGTIYATQNEFADFQVMFHDTGSGTAGYQITVSSFQCTTGPNCTTTQNIAAPDSTHNDIIPYSELYIPDTLTSAIPKTGQPPELNVMLPQGAGHIPDVLVPVIDPYFHQTTNAFPITIAANQNQGAWIDIHVPTTAKSGYYKGTVTLQRGCTGPYPSTGCTTITTVPIILAVWQWPNAGFMPSTSSLFGVNGFGDGTCSGFFGGTGFDSTCANGWPAPAGNINTAITLLKEQSTVMYLDHRVQQSAPYIVGVPWTSFDTYFLPLLQGNQVTATGAANTILPGAKIVNMQYNGNGGSQQDWITHFNANGFGSQVDNYFCDEPPTGCAGGVPGWLQIFQRAQLLHGLTPSMPLQTTTSFSRLASGNGATFSPSGTPASESAMCTSGFSNSGTPPGPVANQPATCLDNSIDWMIPNVVDYANGEWNNLAAYTTWVAGSSNIGTPPLAPHRRYGSYWACDSTACGSQHTPPGSFYIEGPNINLDTTAISHRVTSWFMGYTGATGDLYFAQDICWNSTSGTCTDGTNQIGGDIFKGVAYNHSQGDGTIAYPGRTSNNTTGFGNVGVTTPIYLPSIRLKHWRDGHQDYEYFVVLRANGKSAAVTAAFNSFMNTAPGATGVLAWSFNNTQAPVGSFTSDLPDARQTLGTVMHQLSFPSNLSANIISPSRGTDWTKAGIPSGRPDITWTQCGPTIAPYGLNIADGTTYTVSTTTTNQLTAATSPFAAGQVGFNIYLFGIAGGNLTSPGGGSTSVTLTSGPAAQSFWVNAPININGGHFTITGFTDATHITISPGINTGGTFPWHGDDIVTTVASFISSTQITVAATNAVLTSKFTALGALPATTINNALNHTGAGYTSCTPPYYIQLGSGTFNLTSSIGFSNTNQVALRGSGAASTSIVFVAGTAGASCSGFFQVVNMCGPDTSDQFSGSGPPNYFVGSSGFSQGSSQITLSSPAGNCVGFACLHTTAGAPATPPTLMFVSINNTGYTGFPPVPAGGLSEIDNGNFFVCADYYFAPWVSTVSYGGIHPYATFGGNIYRSNTNPNLNHQPTGATDANWTLIGPQNTATGGCSINGTDGGAKANWLTRWQYELVIPTTVNAGTGLVTLLNPLQMPNYAATGAAPMVWVAQPLYQLGVENISFDTTALGSADTIDIRACYQCWVTGNRFIDPGKYTVNINWSSNDLVADNYFYNAKGPQGSTDPYGVRMGTVGNMVIQNNIVQLIRSNVVCDGPCTGNVIAYNFGVNSATTSGNMWASYWEHATSALNLFEGNIMYQFREDQLHGGHGYSTMFRNLATGWESCANGQCGANTSKDTFTESAEWDNYTRYGQLIGNVFGTPGYHTGYLTSTSFNHNIYGFAIPNGTPTDPLVVSTAMFWGNWDSVTSPAIVAGGVSSGARWCGANTNSGWTISGGCNSTSEIPTSAPVYPNTVPTLGDTGAGQGSMPPSFYLTSKPSWFGSTPWPAIGPDVSGGNIGECSTSSTSAAGLNATGQFNGLPSPDAAHCVGSSIWTGAWAGHVNSIPAMNAYLAFGGNLDGTSGPIPFDASFYSSISPTATLTPSPLAFGNQNIHTTSSGLTATLANTGTVSVTVSNVVVSGPFTNTNTGTCSGTAFTLGVGASCTFVITFSPTGTGPLTGTLAVSDNATGSPQTINLTGTGTVPAITMSSPQGGTTYNFGIVSVGNFATSPGGPGCSTTPASCLEITNTGTGPLNISLTITGTNAAQFSVSASTCLTTLAAGGSCTATVIFTPAAATTYTAFLTETDSVQSLTGNITLNGTGQTPTPNLVAPWPSMIISQQGVDNEIRSFVPCNYVFVFGSNAQSVCSNDTSSSSFLGGVTVVGSDGVQRLQDIGSVPCPPNFICFYQAK